MLCKRSAINENGNQALDQIPNGHRSYYLLSYVLLFPEGRYGWYHGMVIEYDTGSIAIVRGGEGNVIEAGSGAQRLPPNHGCHRPDMIEAKREEE